MDIKNYLKPIGRILEIVGLTGTLYSLRPSAVADKSASNYDLYLGTFLVGFFIRDSLTKNKTIGNYVHLAGLAIFAEEAFLNHVTDNVNLGALVLGFTATIGGEIYSAVERRQHSRKKDTKTLEDNLPQ